MSKTKNEETVQLFEKSYGNDDIIRMEYIVKKYITNLNRLAKTNNADSISGHDFIKYLNSCMEYIITYNNSRNFYTLLNEERLVRFWRDLRNDEVQIYNLIIHCSAEFRMAYNRQEYDEIIDRLSDAFALKQGIIADSDDVINSYMLTKENLTKLFTENVWVVGLVFIYFMDPLV